MMKSCRNRQEKGQVLLMGLLALLILVFVIFLLFDVQNLFRAKIKLQTAVDAACITGANWQMHTLNTVGELNIIKAASVLIEDDLFGVSENTESFGVPQGADDDERYRDQQAMKTVEGEALDRLRRASDTLSQMQYRVLFILPLIGAGAAQQAAKNNGVPSNQEFNTYIEEYLKRIDGQDSDLDLYAHFKTDEFCSNYMYGFLWTQPYTELLRQILYQGSYGNSGGVMTGFAVMPNSVILGQPDVKSDSVPDFSSWLGSKRFYENVRAGNFCALIDFYDARMQCSSSKWWGNITSVLSDSDFVCESEILPTGVRVKTASSDQYTETDWNRIDLANLPDGLKDFKPLSGEYDLADPYTANRDGRGSRKNPRDTDGKISILPALSWAVFKDSWENYSDEFVSDWNDYLIAPLKNEAKYASGAVSRMDSSLNMRSVTGYLGVREKDALPDLSRGLGSFRSGSSDLQRLKRAQEELREDAVEPIGNFALAKPFGSLSFQGKNAVPPHTLELVLPVFTRPTLIPVAMEDPGESPLADWLWYEFLLLYIPKLGTVNSLDDMPESYKSRYAQWHNILKIVDDPEYIAALGVWLSTPRPDYPPKQDGTPVTNREVCMIKISQKTFNVKGGSGTSGYHQVSSGAVRTKKSPLNKH